MFFCWNILPNLWTKIWRRLLGNPNIFDCNHIEEAKTKSETGLEAAVLGAAPPPIWFLPPLPKTCHQISSKFLKSRLTLAWYEAYRANYVKAEREIRHTTLWNLGNFASAMNCSIGFCLDLWKDLRLILKFDFQLLDISPWRKIGLFLNLCFTDDCDEA